MDLVEVFRPARQAVAIGAKTLWLQQGIVSARARRIAEDGGLACVEDRCAAVIRALAGITKHTEHT